MGRLIISILVLLLVSLIGINAVAAPVVQAAVELVGIGVLVGGVVEGVFDYWLGQVQRAVQLIYDEYKHDVDQYTREVMGVYNDGYYKMMVQMESVHATFVNKTYNYYVRWAESIASSVCGPDKATITDEDLKPILDDLVKIVENYVKHFLRSFYDLYRKGWDLSKLRENVGLDPIIYFIGSYYGWVDSAGRICENGAIFACDDLSAMRIDPLGYVDRAGSISVSAENITKMVVGEIPVDVTAIIERSDGVTRDIYGYTVWVSIEEILEKIIRDLRVLYYHAKLSANIYCELVASGAGSVIPPPTIVLPYDLESLSKLDPQARMMLYLTYLQMLSELDWSKISELTPENVTIVDKMTRIEGCVDRDFDGEYELCGGFVPFNIPMQLTFTVNGTWPLGGQVYFVHPDGTIVVRTIEILLYRDLVSRVGEDRITVTSLPTPEGYPYKLYNVTWTESDGSVKSGIGVDVDGDGVVDYVMSVIDVSGLYNVVWDPSMGWYSTRLTLSLTVGPTPVDEWIEVKLKEVGRLEYKDGGRISVDSLKNWWNLLDLKMKALIVGGVLVVLVVLVMVGDGGKVKGWRK